MILVSLTGWVLLIRIKQMIFWKTTDLGTNTASTDMFNDTSYGHLSLAISINSCVFMGEIWLTDNILPNKNLVT